MSETVFVVGLDEFNRRKPEGIAPPGTCDFRPLLDPQEVTARRGYPPDAKVDNAAQIIEAVPGGTHALRFAFADPGPTAEARR